MHRCGTDEGRKLGGQVCNWCLYGKCALDICEYHETHIAIENFCTIYASGSSGFSRKLTMKLKVFVYIFFQIYQNIQYL